MNYSERSKAHREYKPYLFAFRASQTHSRPYGLEKQALFGRVNIQQLDLSHVNRQLQQIRQGRTIATDEQDIAAVRKDCKTKTESIKDCSNIRA